MHAAAQVSDSNPVSIQVDLAKPEGPYTPIYSWFGYDESNYTTMKYGKQLLRELHDLSPVPVSHSCASFADFRKWSCRAEVEFLECLYARCERKASL